jgi:preprotein translocase subunit SecD
MDKQPHGRLTKTPLVTRADITGANASLTEGQWVLNVDVTDEAAQRIQDFSKQNVGRRMAFLVDGKVHRTPRVLDPHGVNLEGQRRMLAAHGAASRPELTYVQLSSLQQNATGLGLAVPARRDIMSRR